MGGGKPVDVPSAEATTTATTTETTNDASTSSTAPRSTQLEKGSQLDLCFLLDSTGSMGSYIQSALASIKDIVTKIVQKEHCDVRFGLISYRDHPPQDATYVTKVFEFTDDTTKMAQYLSEISASGGGDGPEAVTASMFQALGMPWRPNATKVAVIIADAPPHGLGENGDGFPNGDPDGHDPLAIARQMQQRGITIFSVACEPSLSTSYKFAIDFFRGIAKITGGSLLPLTSAALLPDAIIGGAQEQMNLDRLVADAKKEAEELRRQGVAEADLSRNIQAKWASSNVRSKAVKTTEMYNMTDTDVANVSAFCTSESLGSARGKVVAVSSPSRYSESGMAAIASASSALPAGAAAPSKRMSLSRMAAPMMAPMMAAFSSRSSSAKAGAPPMAPSAVFSEAPAPAPSVQSYSVEEDVISIEQMDRIMSKVSSA